MGRRMSEREVRARSIEWVTSLAIWLAVIGGGVLAVNYFSRLPLRLYLLALILFIAGIVLAVTAAFVDGRRQGTGVLRAFYSGIKTALRWIVDFLP
jgi:hypothetical protein